MNNKQRHSWQKRKARRSNSQERWRALATFTCPISGAPRQREFHVYATTEARAAAEARAVAKNFGSNPVLLTLERS